MLRVFFFPNMLPKCVFLKSFICIMILFPTQICRFTSEILRALYSAENIVKTILTIWHIYHMLLAENIRKEKWKNIPVVLIDCGFLLTNCGINPTRFHVDESHWVHPKRVGIFSSEIKQGLWKVYVYFFTNMSENILKKNRKFAIAIQKSTPPS